MSLDLNVFVEKIDDSIIPNWIGRMNEMGMECEIHPDFSFDNHTGFLPFKIRLTMTDHEFLMNKDFVVGFEFYRDPFEYEEELKSLQPKKSLLDKLLNKSSTPVYFASPEIDEKLSKCSEVLTFNWGSADSFELRMASLSSAIISELVNGVCCYPADDIWYDNKNIVEEAYKEILEYEASLKPSDWITHDFEGWNE